MKKIFTLICLLVTVSAVISQENVLDNAYLKCQYEYIWKQDTLSGKTRDDLLILQVGENISKCYSYYSNEVDSLMALPNGDEIAMKMISDAMKSDDFMKGLYPRLRR